MPDPRVRWRSAAAVFVLMALTAHPAEAQFQVQKQVLGSGGAPMGSSSFGVSGTAGQPAVGTVQGETFSSRTGFWVVLGEVTTGIGDEPGTPRIVTLEQNHPNPFNPTTVIPFALPRKSTVRLRVFDVAGRVVQELVDEVRPAGTYREPFRAASLASGIYYYRLETDGLVLTRRLVLLK